jgi:ring-1,2-phenylacetyl-CoA epoxidase subunit PaaE
MMNDEAEAALLAAGVPAERIHIERFGVPPGRRCHLHAPKPGDADHRRIVIVRDGLTREIAFQPDDAQHPRRRRAPAGGAVLLQVGRVRHLPRQAARRPGAHGPQLRARQGRGGRGFVLTCQAHPLTDAWSCLRRPLNQSGPPARCRLRRPARADPRARGELFASAATPPPR